LTFWHGACRPPRANFQAKPEKLFLLFCVLSVDLLAIFWFNLLKMNNAKRTPFYADAKAEFGEVVEDTFTFGPFEVTTHPQNNEENEWVEVEEN